MQHDMTISHEAISLTTADGLNLAATLSAEIETISTEPHVLDQAAIGRFGVFRPKIGGMLWDDALSWPQQQAAALPA